MSPGRKRLRRAGQGQVRPGGFLLLVGFGRMNETVAGEPFTAGGRLRSVICPVLPSVASATGFMRCVLTNCLGGGSPDVKVETYPLRLADGDRLLLCTDGLLCLLNSLCQRGGRDRPVSGSRSFHRRLRGCHIFRCRLRRYWFNGKRHVDLHEQDGYG